ncbi:hypothetical protein B0J11DRAFT_512015 [Dendryphion nanum]|uniref:Uncharacterized protein n=1 Tax=Dendryphion nanum TaxID=256645 RepID=A0A9P9D3I2_9PLEO|nr:hypothetical protein B0J11DRAFT_512015 [Dendryphion nanum]
MNGATEEVLDLLFHTRKVQTTNEFRLTIKTEHEIGYIEVFIWGPEMPNKGHFVMPTVVKGDFDMTSVTEAVKSFPVSSVVASFSIVEERSYNITSQRPLTDFIQGASGICLHEFWTQNVNWRLLCGIVPEKESQAWQLLTSITLELTMDTLDDQLQCREILMKGNLRKFLDQIRTLRHLSLIFYSELPKTDMIWSHAPFEYALNTVTKWPRLECLQLDGFDSTAQELLYFLESHSVTLKALTLRNYFLLSGSWMQTLPEMWEFLSLERAELSGAIEANNELWLVKTPEFEENCFLAEDLGYWLTHPKIESDCPLTKRNLVRKSIPQEEDWE